MTTTPSANQQIHLSTSIGAPGIQNEDQKNHAENGFDGATVAQFESRMRDAMATMVQRQGGVPWLAPALSEIPVANREEVAHVLDLLARAEFSAVILLTGVGTNRLMQEAELQGRVDEVRTALANTFTICRGPKPVHALRRNGIVASEVVSPPHTTAELLDHLALHSLQGERVLIISAGEKLTEPSHFLRIHGANVVELQLYQWALTPDDAEKLQLTVAALISGRIQVAAFTTQVQVRHLFEQAAVAGLELQLARALNERVLTGAVGSTCAAALRDRGVHAHVVPVHPKLGHLVVELAGRYAIEWGEELRGEERRNIRTANGTNGE